MKKKIAAIVVIMISLVFWTRLLSVQSFQTPIIGLNNLQSVQPLPLLDLSDTGQGIFASTGHQPMTIRLGEYKPIFLQKVTWNSDYDPL